MSGRRGLIRPQFHNAVTEKDAAACLRSDVWCAREKYNGRRMLVRKSADGTLTALYVTHNLDEALTLGDRVFLLEEGRIARSCPPCALCAGGGPDEAESSGGCPSGLGGALRAPVFALA